MDESIAIGIAAIVVLGIAAQWLGWRLHLPAILLLLGCGFLAGPEGLGLIDSDAIFGQMLLPLVGVSVAILLFEGGLTLELPELGAYRAVVAKLITLGAAITWVLAALFARVLLGFDWQLAILIGAILTVTGPTVVLPLLRHVRPTGAVGPILKWEGILIDPVGAVLAVLVFEGVFDQAGFGDAVGGIVKTVLLGTLFGVLAAFLLVALLERFWAPDHLHSPVALGLAVGAYALTNHFQHEAGLLTTTVMGAVLANQRRVDVRHILEFKENLRVLIISTLFVVLAARVRLEDLASLNVGAFLFPVALIAVVRPLSVLACTRRSALSRAERGFLAALAPRGVVAAAVAAVFALRLETAGFAGASRLVPTVFLVIVATVAVYGLGAAPLARWLGLAQANPQGVLIIGAHAMARALATALKEQGVDVLLADTNPRAVTAARIEGLPVYFGNVLSEHADEELELPNIGRLFALLPNDEVNALCAMHFVHLFGRGEVYQLAPRRRRDGLAPQLRARTLFGEEATYEVLRRRFDKGATFKATPLTDQFGLDEWRAEHGAEALPLLTVADGKLTVGTINKPLEPAAGQTLIGLV